MYDASLNRSRSGSFHTILVGVSLGVCALPSLAEKISLVVVAANSFVGGHGDEVSYIYSLRLFHGKSLDSVFFNRS